MKNGGPPSVKWIARNLLPHLAAARLTKEKSQQITQEQLEALSHAAYGTLHGWTGHYVPIHSVLALLYSTPRPHVEPLVRGEAGDWIDAVVLDICEIPDRTSPDGEPEIMLVTADELRRLILANLPTTPSHAREKTGWLVERPGPEWLAIIQQGFPMWTDDANKAVLFPSKGAAEKVFATTEKRMQGFEQATATEHAWPPTTLSTTPRICSLCKMEIEAGATITRCKMENCPELSAPTETSEERRLRHRLEKIDKALDDLGAPKSGDWDGLNCELSRVGRIKVLVKRAEEEVELYRTQLHDATVRLAEQAETSRSATPRNAARYEWLRAHMRWANDTLSELWFNPTIDMIPAIAAELDKAIDAAMHAADGGNET